MVSSRKRGRQEMEAVETPKVPPKEPNLLERIRNMWEFANLVQYIFTFGSAVKIDDNMDVEDLEMECLKSQSTVLPELGLALLKFVSSHRGLTPEIFDEYTRRQYLAKNPSRNPFGEDEIPAKFVDFDIFTKIRVLQQLSQWTFGNPDRIREKMPEQKDSEQTIWRIEPFGWDSEDRTYLVLDDNRLYRRTDPPPAPPPTAKPKKNSKKAKAALRASKRRRVSAAVDSDAEPGDDSILEEKGKNEDHDMLGGMKWECIAVSLEDFNNFLTTIEKSRDPNEKQLRKRISDEILPLLEKQEESRKRKALQKERELLNLEKLATAKRSSRIAGRQEQLRQEEEARETERKRQAELEMAKKEQEKWMKLEKERESRMMTREQRLKEREARRILHEEELANLSEDSKKLETGSGRLSERHLKAEIEKKKRALEELAEEDDWIFDCICGAYGKIDDGTHSIACDKCNIWQHSKCVGVSQSAAERDDFHFVCQTCTRRAEDAERAKTQPPIKIKIHRPGSSSSAMAPKQNAQTIVSNSPTGQHDHANGSPKAIASPQKSQSVQPMPTVPTPAIFRPSIGTSLGATQARSPKMGTFTGMFKLNGTSSTSGPKHVPGVPGTNHSSSPKKQNSFPSFPSEQVNISGPNESQPPQQNAFNLAPLAQTYTPAAANGHKSPYSQPSPQLAGSVNGLSNEQSQTQPQPAVGAIGTLTKAHQDYNSHGPIQSSRPPSAGSAQAMPPTPQHSNGHRTAANGTDHRRSSVNMSSPLAGAPLLTPMNKPAMSFSGNGSPVPNFTPSSQMPRVSPPHPLSSPSAAQSSSQQDPGHASALPPASTGISPTKHTPPTPKVDPLSGVFGTPSILPPVASLSPSPQLQNLSPPVKHAEPERSSQSSQGTSQ
ncbi:hypothetical protein BP6252_01118 [Coleophoma cylindrospora]|uniref:Zinc finger PHD-type domain-containing protein n=1 Tax=Coleophoma cylindrospora TaxID=1849047 RepID=A0A3D8SRZ9_9HELO|nr:hypothetical protein BP6252_01118 [Coleophoma cylindrospora]